MRKSILFLLFVMILGLPVCGLAATFNEQEVFHFIKVAENTPLYAEPDKNAAIIAEIPAGGEFTPLEFLQNIPGVDALFWRPVLYKDNGVNKQGYMQYKDYTDNNPIRFGNVVFTCKVEPYDDGSYKGQITFQAIINGKLSASLVMPGLNGTSGYPRFKALSVYGLGEVKLVLEVVFIYDWCATHYVYYAAWDGERLRPLPFTMSYADEEEWHVEKLVFPHNGAPANTILKTLDEMLDPETKTSRYSVTTYNWDGEQAVPMPETPESAKSVE